MTDYNVEDPTVTVEWERDKRPPMVERFPHLTDAQLEVRRIAERAQVGELRRMLSESNRLVLALEVEAGRRRLAAAEQARSNGETEPVPTQEDQ